MKIAMAQIWASLREAKVLGEGREMGVMEPLLQIHDSLMMEVREDHVELANAIVLDGLENSVRLRVPVTASGERGPNWRDLTDFE